MGKKKQTKEVATIETTEVATVETPVATEPVAEPAPKKGRKKKDPTPRVEVTLAQACEGYVRAIEDAGKSQGTVFSYRLELVVAQKELGADTLLCDLTTDRVAEYFASDRVNKTRTGVLKARVSVLKAQRVLRQALQWAASAGLVERAPVPVEMPAA